jgi:tRNA (uracil-5-)-methyltransferase
MREPKCRYFGRCGGCDTQHIEYSLQLKNKVNTVSSLLSIPPELIKVVSLDEYGYRNRMDFVVYSKGIGLRERSKWNSIVEIEECAISNSKLNLLLTEVRQFFNHERRAAIEYAVIRTPSPTSSVSIVLNEDSQKREETKNEVHEFARRTTADNVCVAYVAGGTGASISENFHVMKGSPYLKEKFNGLTFEFHSQSFFQNNSKMAEQMIAYTKKLLSKGIDLLDLYGGVGTFGLSMSAMFNRITVVENSSLSIECAKRNISSLKLKNVEAYVLDAKNIGKLKFSDDLQVITDPPRTGMEPKAMTALFALNPKKIVYISCNPIKLKNELVKFTKKGYVLKSVALFDMFPQTNHMEVIAELVRG